MDMEWKSYFDLSRPIDSQTQDLVETQIKLTASQQGLSLNSPELQEKLERMRQDVERHNASFASNSRKEA